VKARPDIPEERIFEIKHNTKKIDFSRPYKLIYFDLWFELLIFLPFFLAVVLTTFCAVFFSLRVVGRKNLKIGRRTGCITISNHCHYFDTVFASYVFYPRRLYISVVQRNFEVPVVRRILRILRAFPIPASLGGFKTITGSIGEALRRRHSVHFLPEGELVHLSQTIHRFRLGGFYQSYIHQVPLIPMVYIQKRRRFRGKEMRPNWIRMTLVVGEPIYPPPKQADTTRFPKQELDEMAERAASWMEATLAHYHGGARD
jgi:1-acyl-sn-glycerol-3-phosphate acyltransferase